MPALFLLLITPALTELLSGNVQVPRFFLPWVYGPLVIAYGIPAILARDLFIRWRLGLPGLFLFGLAYGIFNEGVLAKTLLLNERVPLNTFDHHAWLGINFPWAALIVPWHACHAIIFPIALAAWWFPAKAATPSLPRWAFVTLSIAVSIFGLVIHLENKRTATPFYLPLFVAVMAGLIFAAKRIGQGGPFLDSGPASTLWPAATGFTFYPVLVLGTTLICGIKAPSVVVIAVPVLTLALYYRLLARRDWLRLTPFVLFAFGDYFSGAMWTGLIMLAKHNLFGVLAEFLLMIAFSAGVIKLAKENYSRAAA